MKYSTIILFLISLYLCPLSFGQAPENEILSDTIPEDTTTVAYKLWKQAEIDTFPYYLTHQNTKLLGISSLLKLTYLGESFPSANDIKHQYARTYVDNLLAKSDTVLDFLETNLNYQFPVLLKDFYGHFGLRRYLSCYNNPSDSCSSIRLWGLGFIKKAADSSKIMPGAQWRWLADRIEQKLPYEKFEEQLSFVDIEIDSIDQADWEGAVLSFSRMPGKKNLIYSNGSKFPLKIFEWNPDTQIWDDSTKAAGLENYPGGSRIYSGDVNNDGHHDLIVLRSASSRSSPAKLFPSALISNGDGTYKDIALDLGLDKMIWPQCFCMGDFNQDGRSDLYFGGLRDESILLLQNKDSSFTNKQYVYGLNELGANIQDCLFSDINHDGKQDLLLSANVNHNRVYIQGLTDDVKQVYFGDRAEEYDFKTPTFGGAVLSGNTDKNREGVLFLSEVSERYDVFPFILSETDSIVRDTSYYLTFGKKGFDKRQLPKELALYRSGVWIQTFDGMRLLYSGGKTPESLLPFFEYNLNTDEVKVAYQSELPLYTHSTTVIEQDGQPVILFKGGGDYPLMRSSLKALSYKPDTTGQYHKIFDFENETIGSNIEFNIITDTGDVFKRSLTVREKDSKGNHAMQEWIWLPEEYHLVRIEGSIPDKLTGKEIKKLLKQEKKKAKKKKKKK